MLRIFHLVVFAIMISACAQSVAYQPWLPYKVNSSIGTGYKLVQTDMEMYDISYEAAFHNRHDDLRPYLHRLAKETCTGAYELRDARDLELIVTHSTGRSVYVEAQLVCKTVGER